MCKSCKICLLSGKEGKIVHQQILNDLRKSLVLRIDAQLSQKVEQENAHLKYSELIKDRIVHDQIKFAALAKDYKAKPGMHIRSDSSEQTLLTSTFVGPPTGQRRRRDDDDDGDEDGPGPDDFGPRSRWSVDRLCPIDRQTLEEYPPPSRDAARDNSAVDEEADAVIWSRRMAFINYVRQYM